MTTAAELGIGSPEAASPGPEGSDRRGSVIPTAGMIRTRLMELRKRRGLMIGLVAVDIGIPTVFLLVRLIAHAASPRTYGPAGGYVIFSDLVAGVMYVFGFIIAATLGCTAGSVDLSEGMFRHLVVTGRSRLALYFARIPAGLGIVVPVVAVGFAIVCFVCVYAAPTTFNYNGVTMPAGLSRPAFEAWASDHADEVVCEFGFSVSPNSTGGGPPANVPCGPNGVAAGASPATPAIKAFAVRVADENYADYANQFRIPPVGLMVRSGLWLELEAAIGFLVGLGLASLLGQRTLSVILMIVLEVVLTPVFSRPISHIINLQRSVVGVAMTHLEPGALPTVFGGGGGNGPGAPHSGLVPETMTQTIVVVVAWIVVWTAVGAWRMLTRDA